MTDYKLLCETVEGYCQNEPSAFPLLSNISSVIYDELEDLNWAGFYLLRKKDTKEYVSADFLKEGIDKGQFELVVGPFQGKPACIRIPIGKGVCGSACEEMKVFRVEDVHTFPGHIACDCASNSEIVVPLMKEGEVYGVLDIDSPILNRFTIEDEEGLKKLASIIDNAINF
ncbi:MAG: GAF domain-containing protein [Lachnospiraceae bacterium]|nr:GAF domain-containing protein [Lachnospiraceae bacterium]